MGKDREGTGDGEALLLWVERKGVILEDARIFQSILKEKKCSLLNAKYAHFLYGLVCVLI